MILLTSEAHVIHFKDVPCLIGMDVRLQSARLHTITCSTDVMEGFRGDVVTSDARGDDYAVVTSAWCTHQVCRRSGVVSLAVLTDEIICEKEK